MTWCPMSDCATISIKVPLSLSLISATTFCSVCSVMAILLLTTVCLISDVCVSISKLFHPPSDCWYTCRHVHMHDEVAHRCLRLSCSPSWWIVRIWMVLICAWHVFILVRIDVTTDYTYHVLLYTAHVCSVTMLMTFGMDIITEFFPESFPTFFLMQFLGNQNIILCSVAGIVFCLF